MPHHVYAPLDYRRSVTTPVSLRQVLKLLVALALCGLAGCATPPGDPNLTTDHREIGGSISLEARRLTPNTYDIRARGTSLCTEEQLMQAWLEMAEKMAAGKAYKKATKTESYSYTTPSPFSGPTYHTGLQVSGRISLLD